MGDAKNEHATHAERLQKKRNVVEVLADVGAASALGGGSTSAAHGAGAASSQADLTRPLRPRRRLLRLLAPELTVLQAKECARSPSHVVTLSLLEVQRCFVAQVAQQRLPELPCGASVASPCFWRTVLVGCSSVFLPAARRRCLLVLVRPQQGRLPARALLYARTGSRLLLISPDRQCCIL
ncbi:unnamed protein product [Prorocentrum cordatum]|uniref:Uncharacterized protein n=1 Tax=Prorocentrum cordatum TaxID=2364126 RepID=A0ABN9SDG8_9DINO|nr:unnamed protein product [Polarella glacialis]